MAEETLDSLAASLRQAADEAKADIEKVLKRGAVNVKRDWRKGATGLRNAPAYPYSITFDPVGELAYEIGPDKNKRQGALGNLIEYGSVNNGPHNHGKTALEAEEPRLEANMVKVIYDRLKG